MAAHRTFSSSQILPSSSSLSPSSFVAPQACSLPGLRCNKCWHSAKAFNVSNCDGILDRWGKSRCLKIIANAVEQAAATSVAGGVLEVTQETFWPVVEAAGDKLVVLDMYTQWCGPCKIMYPKLVELSGKYTDVLFLKLDCNQDNKALAKNLGIRVVPTFKLFKHRQEVGEVKGAKYDELVQSIEKARASS